MAVRMVRIGPPSLRLAGQNGVQTQKKAWDINDPRPFLLNYRALTGAGACADLNQLNALLDLGIDGRPGMSPVRAAGAARTPNQPL